MLEARKVPILVKLTLRLSRMDAICGVTEWKAIIFNYTYLQP